MSQHVKSGLGLVGMVAVVLVVAIGLLGGATQGAPAQSALAAPLVITPSAEPPTLTPTPTDTPLPPTLTPTPTDTPVPPTLTPTPTSTLAPTGIPPAPTATRPGESVVTSTPTSTPTLLPPLLPETGSAQASPAPADFSGTGAALVALGALVVWGVSRRLRRAAR